MISSKKRARLLALDQRRRYTARPDRQPKQEMREHLNLLYRFTVAEGNLRNERSTSGVLRVALRDLLVWNDQPPKGWTAADLRRLDEIRALAERPTT